MPIPLSQFIAAMETIAPTRFAEPWDNVGLLAGDPGKEGGQVSRAILAIDYTKAVAQEAQELQCNLVIAYHPPIFEGLRRITGPSLVYDAIRRGVAIYSPHTAWDVAEGGVNDFLADLLGVKDRRPLRLAQGKAENCKLVVFVPQEAVEKVSAALFAAGAGRIGKYSGCSFRSPGKGTFFGEEGSNPAVGTAGKSEEVDELRLETVVPMAMIDRVISAMRSAHPYEEPAFDLVPLAAAPEGIGQGRIGTFDPPVDRKEILERIRSGLGVRELLVAGPVSGEAKSAACLAGAGGEHLKDALEQRADLYLTGEVRHHDALKAAERGMTVVCALHSNSERASLRRLSERIKSVVPELELNLSKQDRDPFVIV